MPVEAHRIRSGFLARRTGFTLIELVIVLTLLAIMTAAVVPAHLR